MSIMVGNKIIGFLILLSTFFFIGTLKAATIEANVGFEDGVLTIKSTDKNYLMRIGGRLQLRYWYAYPYKNNPRIVKKETSTFEIYQARFFIWGHAFNEKWRYKLQLDFAADNILKDAYLDYVHADYIGLQAGRFKVPFSRQKMSSGISLLFPKRSITNDYISLGRDVGLMAHGSFFEKRLGYQIGVWNGDGENTKKNNGKLKMAALRVLAQPLGEVGLKEARNETMEGFRYAIGASFAYNRQSIDDLDKDGDEDRADDIRWGAEAAIAWERLFISAELCGIANDPEVHDYGQVNSLGWYIQGGYLIIEKKLQAGVRYAWWDPNTHNDHDGSDADVEQEITTGLNYFIYTHRLLLQGSYSYLTHQHPKYQNLEEKIEPYDNRTGTEHRLMLQLQLII